ncbi:MAG TPA: methyltransferase domain-containing protein [Terriglobales bacterium]|nr:methyltransferase domain-containing protein [Terriglobales bacterium]
MAVEIRVFAYFKNLALLLCFLGFGIGCALARKPIRWLSSATALFGLLLLARWPHQQALESLSQNLGSAADINIWRTGEAWNWGRFLPSVALAGLLLLLLVCVFIPIGQKVSRQMDLAPNPLTAYSWNLAGSLAGILVFFGVCRLMLPPTFWLGAVLVGFALLQRAPKERLLMAGLIVPLALLLHDPATVDHFDLWTPYQQIEFTRLHYPNGDFAAANVEVNHIGYQTIVDLSPKYLHRHPGIMKEAPEDNPYNLPFRFATPHPAVLIVGAGTGDDAAAALRYGARSVDAVDIDPAIIQLGRREHPEHPYDSPLVKVHLGDARAFLKRATKSYDLILFALLDSHTQFSDYSNMRIDNFVYTMESLREARRHLTPHGVLFVKFNVARPWLGQRLQNMLTQTFGKPPLMFFAPSSYSVDANCFVISNSGQVETVLAGDPELQRFVSPGPHFPKDEKVVVTTDDWPYLYQQGRWIPRTYYSLGLLVILLAMALYWQIPEARQRVPSLFFFAMGAGFLLLETQVISRLALYFGTTWQVNGVVLTALLTTLLVANAVIERQRKPWPARWMVAGLLAPGPGWRLLVPLRPPGRFRRVSGLDCRRRFLRAYIFCRVTLCPRVPCNRLSQCRARRQYVGSGCRRSARERFHVHRHARAAAAGRGPLLSCCFGPAVVPQGTGTIG